MPPPSNAMSAAATAMSGFQPEPGGQRRPERRQHAGHGVVGEVGRRHQTQANPRRRSGRVITKPEIVSKRVRGANPRRRQMQQEALAMKIVELEARQTAWEITSGQ